MRAIKATGNERDIPKGFIRKVITEEVAYEHDEHLSKMKELSKNLQNA